MSGGLEGRNQRPPGGPLRKLSANRHARETYRGYPCFERTTLFCERWDQSAFDPGYDTLPLEAFEPMLRRVFAREPFSQVPCAS